MSEILAHLAISVATRLKDPGLEVLIRNHKADSANAYSTFPCPIDENSILSVFNKFCRHANFPATSSANPSKEVHFGLNNFAASDIKAFVWYLDKKGIHSEFRPSSGMPSTLNLVIKDANNTHIKMTQTPVSVFHLRHTELLEEERRIAAAQRPSYIPPFNLILTDRRIHILLDHMHYEDRDLLEKGLQSRGVEFTPEDHDDYGTLLTIRFKHVVEVSDMKKEARTAENLGKAPDSARMYRPAKGYPTINLLEDREKLCVPLEGMLPNQIEALKTRIAPTRLPYEQVNHPDFGIVLSFDKQYSQHLEGWRTILRAEHKRNTATAEIQPIQPAPL